MGINTCDCNYGCNQSCDDREVLSVADLQCPDYSHWRYCKFVFFLILLPLLAIGFGVLSGMILRWACII